MTDETLGELLMQALDETEEWPAGRSSDDKRGPITLVEGSFDLGAVARRFLHLMNEKAQP